MLKLNKKSLVAGIAIGVVGGLLAMPAIQFAAADEMNVEPYEKAAKNIAVVDSSGKVVSLEELQKIEAEEEALDAREDQLEQDYKDGKISREEYLKQKEALEAEDDALDAREDKAEQAAGVKDDDDDFDDDDDVDDNDDIDDDDDDVVVSKPNKPNNNSEIAAAKKKLAEIEKQQQALDAKEDQLERDYENGKISKAEFLKQEAALEAEEDRLDALEDKYENILERYGIDDDDDEEDDD